MIEVSMMVRNGTTHMPCLPSDDIKRLIRALTPLFSTRERRENILMWAFWDDQSSQHRVNLDQSAIDFTQQLIAHLARDNCAALMALLQAVQEREEGDWIERLQPYVEQLRQKLSPAQPRYRLFVSYRRKSWDFTHRLVADLRARINADIFIDFSSIDSTDFEASILRHLRESDCVLLVVSEHTFDERIHDPQDWMRREIGEALRIGKPIVLLAHEGRYPPHPDQLPLDIRAIGGRQGIEFYPRFYDAALEKLIEFIPKAIANPPAPYQPAVLPPDRVLDEESAALHRRLIMLCEIGDYTHALPLLEHLATLQRQREETLPLRPQGSSQRAQPSANHDTNIISVPRAQRTVPQILGQPFDWCDVLAGPVRLERGGYLSHNAARIVSSFRIAKYPITNAQFERFMRANGYDEPRWWTSEGWRVRIERAWCKPRFWDAERWNRPDYPVVGISWYEAVAFCHWLSEVSGETIALPTEAQWQRAAQGKHNYIYPWGDIFEPTRCNCNSDGTTPVTRYEGSGDSPFGAVDMCGNVWEWCLTDYQTGDESLECLSKGRVRRGGSWVNKDAASFRAAKRDEMRPDFGLEFIGFRIVRNES
jgi:hypothetical protein